MRFRKLKHGTIITQYEVYEQREFEERKKTPRRSCPTLCRSKAILGILATIGSWWEADPTIIMYLIRIIDLSNLLEELAKSKESALHGREEQLRGGAPSSVGA